MIKCITNQVQRFMLTKPIKGVSWGYTYMKGVIRCRRETARGNFYLSDLQLKRLNLMSKKMGLSASEILRRAIDEYWERFEKKEKNK